jgi:predicted ATPase/serine phosphatase RsbU (regulator of sigma subunit)
MPASVPGYSILEEIYDGKRTRVLRAVRTADGTPVILKRLKAMPSVYGDVLRLQHEDRMLRRVSSPCVIGVLGMEEGAEGPALVVEDFGALSLAEIHQRSRMDITRILQVALQVARALGDIHTAGVVHRDINPSNIVVHPATGKVKVIDFGIASTLKAEEAQRGNPNLLEGTLAYISPEQTGRMNRSVDYRTDFYSLGITLYELLIGWRPFQSDDALELVHQHLSRAVPVPHELNADIPSPLSAIVMKLVEKAAEDRYQTAEGLVADLQKCLHQWKESGRIDAFELGSVDASDRLLVPARLYGRDRERAVILDGFSRCAGGTTVFCLLKGEEGVGKSRLVQELYPAVVEHQGLFVSGRVDPLNRDIPFSALVEAFGELARYLLASSEAEIQEWRQSILAAVGENVRILTDLVPEMEMLLGQQAPVQDLPPVEAQNRFRCVILDFLHVVSKPGRPFVLFLDDLQWADPSTLDLLIHLLNDARRRSLMLVTAMRTDDPGTAGVEERLQASAGKTGVEPIICSLGSLNEQDLALMLSETLGCDASESMELARLVRVRTGGNPHFVNLFLNSVYESGDLRLDRVTRRWTWDVRRLQETTVTENVARHLTQGLRGLSGDTQALLAGAACEGSVFSLDIIAGVSGRSLEEANDLLWPVLRDGLIVPVGGEYRYVRSARDGAPLLRNVPEHFADVRYRFSHDRVREAALGLVSAMERARIHHTIGTLLLQRTPDVGESDKLFAIAAHLNHGEQADRSVQSALMRRRINILAGKRAQVSSAFASAHTFYANAVRSIVEGEWETETDVAQDVFTAAAVCAYASGKFSEAEGYFAAILERVRSPLKRARIHRARVDFYIHASRREDAIRAAMEGLHLVGVSLPRNPGRAAVTAKILNARLRLIGRTPDRLLDAPAMKKEEPRIALGILISLMNIAYSESPEFSGYVVGTMMNLTLRYGNSDESAYAYAIYGLFLGAGFGDYGTAREFGELSLRLIDRAQSPFLRGRCYFLMACLLNHWRQPFRTNHQYLDECYASAMASGDLHYASYALTQRTMLGVIGGASLQTVATGAEEYGRFASGIQYEDITPYFVCALQYCRALRGETSDPLTFDSPGWNEEQYVRWLDQSSFAPARTWYWLLKLHAAVLCRSYKEATEIAERMQPILYAMTGQVIEPDYWLYTALAIAGLPAGQRNVQRQRLFRKALRRLETWAAGAPENFQSRALLCQAESFRLRGDVSRAALLYERAIVTSEEHGFPQLAGLAAENASYLHRQEGHGDLADAYRERARVAYTRWGARSKALTLTGNDYGVPGSSRGGTTVGTSTIETGQETLDLNTVLKASQAISGEILLQRVLERLLKVVMENAGASRGLYIRVDGTTLVPEAEGIAGGAMRVLPGLPERDIPLADAVVRYVLRTGETVTLEKGVADMRFTADAYLRSRHPAALLCMPVVRHGVVHGVLYLENEHMAGSFNADRREMLRLLTGQIAISLENARLVEKEKDLARIQEQVRLASRIQSDLLPHEAPPVEGYLMAGKNIPAQEVGGDYFDFLETGDGSCAVCVGDVSGKGLPASLLMANLQATLRGQVLSVRSPGECLGRANTLLNRSTSPEKFATLILGVLNPSLHTFAYANAGHEHPFVVRHNGEHRSLSGGGPPLAMLESMDYETEVYELTPGDAIAIYSDGIPEAMDPEGVMFGHERLHALLAECRGDRPEVMLERTLAAVTAHTRGAPQSDDITLVILQRLR